MICPLCHKKNTNFFHTLNGFHYYQCNTCVTLFLSPQPSKKKLDTFYKTQFDYSYAAKKNEEKSRTRARKIASAFLRYNPQGKSVLDVGTGYGFVLDEFKKKGFSVLGLEPSKELRTYAKKMFQLPVISKSLEEYKTPKKFDFIILIHVIEHVKDPAKFIHTLNQLLHPKGVIFIETPNADSHSLRFEKKDFPFLLVPEHLWIFSLISITSIISNVPNLVIKKASTYSYPEHFMGVIKHILRKSERKTLSIKRGKNDVTQRKKLKIFFFNRLISSLLYRSLNLFDKGTVLEIYLQKK